MTPRSRKPVLLVSGTNINNLAKLSPTLTHLQEEESHTRPNSYAPLHRLHLNKIAACTRRNEIFTLESSKRPFTKSKSDGDLNGDQTPNENAAKLNKTDSPQSLSTTFRQYLNSRDIITFDSPTDSTFSSRSDDFQSYSDSFRDNQNNCGDENMTESMLYILDGNNPSDVSMNDSVGEKKLVLKPRQFDENGKPIVFETSF